MSRIMQMTGLLVTLAAAFALAACGDKGGGAAAKMKSYPDTTAGLKDFMTDFSAAANGGNEKLAQEMQASLALPDARAFFGKYWEADVADALVKEYEALVPYDQLSAALVAMKKKGRTEFTTEKFVDLGNENAIGYQDIAIKRMIKIVPLHSFRATPPGKRTGQHIFSFVYVDGGWRLAGPMWSIEPAMKQDEKMHALAQMRGRDRAAFLNTGKLPDDE